VFTRPAGIFGRWDPPRLRGVSYSRARGGSPGQRGGISSGGLHHAGGEAALGSRATMKREGARQRKWTAAFSRDG
jgi:hypothetical protein